MRRSLSLLLALALFLVAAERALAQGLYVVADRTVPAGGSVPISLQGPDGEAVVRAFRVRHPGRLLDAGIALDRGERLAFLDPRFLRATPAEQATRQQAGLVPALTGHRIRLAGGRSHDVDLPLSQPGLYLVAVQHGTLKAYATALVSDLGLVVKRSEAGLLAWAVHRTTGRPWPGVELSVGTSAGPRRAGRTGTDGTVLLEGALPATADVRAAIGEHLALGATEWFASAAADRRVYVHTHQPAYRPGEQVEWKGIVRRVDQGRLLLDPDVEAVLVRLFDAAGTEVWSTQAELSSGMGSFSASFPLPEDAPTGSWRIQTEVGGDLYDAPLEIAAYRKPAFEVRVQGENARVMAGGTSSFEVEAQFYDGGRLGEAAVSWQLLYHRVDRELFAEDALVKLFFGSEREAYRPETLTTGQGTLDAEGRLVVPVTIPADKASGFVSLAATVAGPDRMAVAGSGRIAVSTAPVVVALVTDAHLYGPEDVAGVTVRAELADGSPASARAGVLTVGLAPEHAEGEPPEETWLHTLPFTTNAQGEAHLEAPLADAGRYALAVTLTPAEGETGAPAWAKVHVWAAGERSTPGHTGAGLEVIADEDAYEVGQTAKLLVLPIAGTRPVLATLEREGILSYAVLVPGEVPPLWNVELGEAHVPNVFATFTSVDHGRLVTTTRVLRVPPRTRLLTTTVTPDMPELDPGATSGFRVEVTDHAGAGVAGAEVDVAIVDEALLALYADPAAPLEAFFHPPVRNAVGTQDLLDWRSVGWAALPPSPAKSEAMDGADDAGAPRPTASPSAGPGAPPPPASARPGDAPPAEAPAPEPVMDSPDAEESVEMERAENGDDNPRFAGALEKKSKKQGRQAVRVREDFRSAIYWAPALQTDAEGRLRVDTVQYGDSLTRWRLSAKSVDASTRVGTGTATVRTLRKVAAQVTLPRFLRAGDVARVPLVLRNLTNAELEAQWALVAESAEGGWTQDGTVTLPGRGLRVIEQEFASRHVEDARFLATLTTDVGGDAERRSLPVLPRGIPKVEGWTLFAHGGATSMRVDVPDRVEPDTIRAHVTLEPAYAQAMLGALPYLQEYPYGCTEQTLHRFLPLVAAAEALKALGREPKGLATEMPKMIHAGLARLSALQHEDGGFGWWEGDTTDLGMTALVVRGLARLEAAHPGDTRVATIQAKALAALAARQGDVGRLDVATRASVVLALAAASAPVPADALPPPGDGRWRTMPPMAQALLLRAAVAAGRTDLVTALRGQLDDAAIRTKDGFLYWEAPGASPQEPVVRWQDDAVETSAVAMLALLEAGIRHEMLHDGVTWLLDHRVAGSRWQSTRDTAAAVEVLAAIVRKTGDLGAGRTVKLSIGGTVVFEGALTLENAAKAPLRFEVPATALQPASNFGVALESDGGAVSASIVLAYDATGPAISAAENGFRVTRSFYRLAPSKEAGRVVWTRTPITETLPAGTLVECEIAVESPRPHEYVMVTSPHVAGFEPAEETGMDVPGRTIAVEARTEGYDDRTMFFVARLAPTRSVFRHTMRATHAGAFTALPAMAELMYFPQVRGNSSGEQWQVTPAGPVGTDDSREGGE